MLSLSFCATRSVRFGRRRHRIRGLTIDPRGSIDGGKEKNKGGGRVVFVTEDVIAQEAQGWRLLFCHVVDRLEQHAEHARCQLVALGRPQ